MIDSKLLKQNARSSRSLAPLKQRLLDKLPSVGGRVEMAQGVKSCLGFWNGDTDKKTILVRPGPSARTASRMVGSRNTCGNDAVLVLFFAVNFCQDRHAGT
jgi:hypothetical protein